MEHTFKIGDKVRVRDVSETHIIEVSQLEPTMSNVVTSDMLEYIGVETTIVDRHPEYGYFIAADNRDWCWLPEWLERVEE